MRQLTIAALIVALTACGLDGRSNDFRDGFPRASTVKFDLPQGSTAQPLSSTGTRRDGLEGERAQFYTLTRGVTVLVNSAAVATLALVERITDLPATTVSENEAVWGPHTDALSPNTWRFTVKRRAPNDYTYVLEGKGKTESDEAYRVVLSGAHVTQGKALGNGSFLIDWSVASGLPEHDSNVGTASFTYARAAANSTVSIDANFAQVKDGDSGQLVDAGYHYRQVPNAGGSLEFSLNKNALGGPAIELLMVKSRWAESGAGRSDVELTGVDLGSTVATASECWDSAFASRYFITSYDTTAQWGNAAVCAYSTAEYARR